MWISAGHKSSKKTGFTLIEVLIALLIIAIALAAVIKSTNDSIHSTLHVKNTMAAHWVAVNLLSQMQTGIMQPPKPGHTLHVKSEMLNQSWQVTINTDNTVNIPGSERVQIHVYLNNKLITSFYGFIPITLQHANLNIER